MLKNHIKIAWRSLKNNRLYTLLNIFGLGSGMAAALLIALWLADELSTNKYHEHYDRIALLQKNRHYNGNIFTEVSNPIPLGEELKNRFPDDLEEVVVSSYGGQRSLRRDDKTLFRRGLFMQEGGIAIMDLHIIEGEKKRQLDPETIYISKSLKEQLFGDESPIGKMVRMDENIDLEVVGVFEDFPQNATYKALHFYSSFKTLATMEEWVRASKTDWSNNSFPIYIKIAPNTDFETVSSKIESVLYNVTDDVSKPELFLHPMEKWHLHTEFKDGKPVGTGVKNLWLFGGIGIMILLLASINFMNLSTARSMKRAKEIGIRKTLGSRKKQLVRQFLTETYVTVIFATIVAFILAFMFLPIFNRLANDTLSIPWDNGIFIVSVFVFMMLIGFLSGTYPAFYLSAFDPVNVLKGSQKKNKKEAVLRKGMVMFQFGIAIALIIGTVIVYQQINFAKNRPMGYEQNNLIFFQKRSDELQGHFYAMREQLLASGAIMEMAESLGPVTDMWIMASGFEWKGKAEGTNEDFISLKVTPEFGKTTQWKISEGRDFSRGFATDTEAMILNTSAAEYMGFENPIGEVVRWQGKQYNIVGVCENLVMESPFEKVRPTVFTMKKANLPFVTMRMNPALSVRESKKKITSVLHGFSPNGGFNLRFVDEEFGQKLWREEQVADLATALSIMAILISCLGIYGLSSFMAEQRRKEIGVRKVLGASVCRIVHMIFKDFIFLTSMGCCIAFPIAYSFMSDWLSTYELRTAISWWPFAIVGLGTLLLTLFTVSFKSIHAANSNPIKSLRTE